MCDSRHKWLADTLLAQNQSICACPPAPRFSSYSRYRCSSISRWGGASCLTSIYQLDPVLTACGFISLKVQCFQVVGFKYQLPHPLHRGVHSPGVSDMAGTRCGPKFSTAHSRPSNFTLLDVCFSFANVNPCVCTRAPLRRGQ